MFRYPKQILNIEQQIQSYIDAEMEINSRDEVENALRTIGYYRLRGYVFQVYDNDTKKYTPGTKFEDILKIYYFDQKLSNMIFSMLSKIEVALRARMVDALLIHKDALILQDSSIFQVKNIYWKNMSAIASEIARSNDVFIKHNFERHEGEIPVWAVVEVISFGTLSKIIKNLRTGENSVYSALADNYRYTTKKGNLVRPAKKMFTSWVHSVTVLRNMCAHNSRIYNRTIHTAPEILATDKVEPAPTHNGLYQVLLAMKYLRSSDADWKEFIAELDALLKAHADVISLMAMNFPEDWQLHLVV